MSWTEYQAANYRTKPNYLAVYLANNIPFNYVIDLGCGSGNETVYFLKKGKTVTAVDAYLNSEYILNRINESQKKHLTLISAPMEDVNLPPSDVILSMFVLPFCKPSHFNKVWIKITTSIKKDGYIAANLFGNRDYHKDNGVIVFTREEVLTLLNNFEIIKWKEQEYTREKDNTHWHYFDFIARKRE